MEKNLYVFENEEFGKVRVVDMGRKTYFVGGDIVRALGYKDTSILRYMAREEDRLVLPSPVFKMTGPLGGEMIPLDLPDSMKNGRVGLINEIAVQSLINASNAEWKQRFKLFIGDVARAMFNRASLFEKEEKEGINPINTPVEKEEVVTSKGMTSVVAPVEKEEVAAFGGSGDASYQGIIVEIFKNKEFGEVRTLKMNGRPMFVANDVAAALGYKNHSKAIADHCKSGDIISWGTIYIPHSNGFGGTNAIIIGEANLYRLIMHSQLPNAEKFQDWICEEVLPSISKHGAYLTEKKVEEALLNPDVLIQLATTIKEERQKRIEAEAEVKLIGEKAMELQKENEEMKPESLFAKAVKASKDTILVGDLAKFLKQNGVNMGQNRLFEWLRKRDYLGSRGNYRNKPTQRAIDLGIFQVEEKTFRQKNGYTMLTLTTRVTGKGQVYLLNKILEGEEERESSDEEGKQTWRLA
jgi:anti-repressor protein